MDLTIKQIDEQLAPLRKQHDTLDKQMMKLCKLREKLVDKESSEYIAKISKDPKEITKEQWKWILSRESQGMVHYNFGSDLLQRYGFSSFGFMHETLQPCIKISRYGYDTEKAKEGFKILKVHLKPITVEGEQSTETGIRFEVANLEENTTSILYVHKENDAILYINDFDIKKFKSFNEFADWYTTAEKKD